MNFGHAIEEVKEGSRIARKGWNGDNMFVYYVPSLELQTVTDVAIESFGETVVYEPYLAIKNAKGTVSTWVGSINDILAEDWEVVL